MHLLQKLQNKTTKLAIGLMSGTSVDGVDAALVRVSGSERNSKIEVLNFNTFDYPAGLKERILSNSQPGHGSIDEICRLNTIIGEIFADAALKLINDSKLKPGDIDFIGSHGQTFHHLPEEEALFGYKIRSTLQLGEPSVIARRTGILTVADFRPADMAEGGLGAPLVPYFDFIFFRSPTKDRALLNIGGIANFTLLKKNCDLDAVIAFDTGPGNMVIDYLMQKLFNKPYDKNGEVALSGNVDEALLTAGLAHPYFKRRPPKATGREMFGQAFADNFLLKAEETDLQPDDIIATASELTVRTIWGSYIDSYAAQIKLDEFIVSGGGARNKYFMKRLAELAKGVRVCAIDDFGISADAKEAVCFAVLANETICGNTANVPNVTGARKPAILGKICF